MKIRIHVPSHLGAYKLSKQARRASAKKLVERHLKLFAKMREKVSSVILVVDGKNYVIEPRSDQKVLVEHTQGLLSE